jgi:putative endonuclease
MTGYVYILASGQNGTLYTGVTSDLQARVSEHKQGINSGFASKYGCHQLVWHERHDGIESAIQREKSIKKYKRSWKVNLIEALNPHWNDLFEICYDIDNPFQPTFTKRFEPTIANPALDHRHGGR